MAHGGKQRIGGAAWATMLAGVALTGTAHAQRFHYYPPARTAPMPGAPLDDIGEDVPDSAQQAVLDARVAALVPVQNYVPRPALWRIGDRDTTIWLFGTVHVLPPGFRWRSPLIETVAKRADTLIVESVDDPAAGDPFLGKDTPPLPPLSARVSASHRAKLAALYATLPPAAVATLEALPTWVAAVAVSVARDIRAGDVPGPGADDWFERTFRAAGKRVLPIEDGAKVAAAANAIPDAEARALLDRALDAPASDPAVERAPIDAWARGQVGPGSPIMVAMPSQSLSDTLMTQRNAAWAVTLKRRLAVPGTMLFVAGAGHFIGSGSVLERLAAAGVTVTRVQ